MPTYRVTVTEVVEYELEVEADSVEEAEEMGEDKFLQTEEEIPLAITERTFEAEEI